MESKHYKLRFLPLFAEDLSGIVHYISNKLQNPAAAENLVDLIQNAIRERSTCAEAFESYHSLKERQYSYYRIYVKNYMIFYVVIDDVMEVRRILYNKRNLPENI